MENDQTLIRQSDIVWKDEMAMVFVASYFIGRNDGHLIVVLNEHFENIYDLPDELGAHVFALARKFATVMREVYGCEGVMMQQNNEPASGQHAFHYHMHLFPRYEGDEIHAFMGKKRVTVAEERLPFAEKIRRHLALG